MGWSRCFVSEFYIVNTSDRSGLMIVGTRLVWWSPAVASEWRCYFIAVTDTGLQCAI